MHEYSFTQSIIDAVIESIKPYHLNSVLEIEIEIGEFSTFIPDQIKFCYEIIVKGNPVLESTNIIFTKKKGLMGCYDCDYKGSINEIDSVKSFSCPLCGGYMAIIEGNECIIKKIKMDQK